MKTRENDKKGRFQHCLVGNNAVSSPFNFYTRLTFTALVNGVSIVYESRQHGSDHALPPNVENFLVELFQEPPRNNPSDEHEKLQADKTQQLDLFDSDDYVQDVIDNMRHQSNQILRLGFYYCQPTLKMYLEMRKATEDLWVGRLTSSLQ